MAHTIEEIWNVVTEAEKERLTRVLDPDALPRGTYWDAHGAVGDGVTDDTAAIQAAIDASIARSDGDK